MQANLAQDRHAKTITDLIILHISDLQETGKPLRRPKHPVLDALKRDIGATRISKLDRSALIKTNRAHLQTRSPWGAGHIFPRRLPVGLGLPQCRSADGMSDHYAQGNAG
ncbi:MAG: hypothetical protein HKN11_16750 [Rhizobiales bacterium]|nr:hypothetical protein [Hyphomicrobiales bacterium]